MAIPSLKHQIEFVDTIVILKAIAHSGQRKYRIEEVLKSKYAVLNVGDFVKADLSIFDLLGYKVEDDQQVIAFLALRKDLSNYDRIDFLPVENKSIHYGKEDVSVRESLTLEELRSLISNIVR